MREPLTKAPKRPVSNSHRGQRRHALPPAAGIESTISSRSTAQSVPQTGVLGNCARAWVSPPGPTPEDTAPVHGARCRDNHVSAIGDVGTFSFYPRDIHAATQGILVFAYTGEDELAGLIIDWVVNDLYVGGGRCYHRKYRFHARRVVPMRWCVAWMAYALGEFERARRLAPDDPSRIR